MKEVVPRCFGGCSCGTAERVKSSAVASGSIAKASHHAGRTGQVGVTRDRYIR